MHADESRTASPSPCLVTWTFTFGVLACLAGVAMLFTKPSFNPDDACCESTFNMTSAQPNDEDCRSPASTYTFIQVAFAVVGVCHTGTAVVMKTGITCCFYVPFVMSLIFMALVGNFGVCHHLTQYDQCVEGASLTPTGVLVAFGILLVSWFHLFVVVVLSTCLGKNAHSPSSNV